MLISEGVGSQTRREREGRASLRATARAAVGIRELAEKELEPKRLDDWKMRMVRELRYTVRLHLKEERGVEASSYKLSVLSINPSISRFNFSS